MTTTKREQAIARFRAFLDKRCADSGLADLQVVKFERQEVTPTTTFVTAQLECGPSVRETSLLRLLSSQYWLVSFGPRGGTTVRMAPKECRQFNGRRAFGMLFKL